MKLNFKLWMPLLLLPGSLALAMSPCPNSVTENDLKGFGPRYVSTEFPFHYNFKITGNYELTLEGAAIDQMKNEASFVSTEPGPESLLPVAAYKLDTHGDRKLEHIIYRYMFVPKAHQSGFYRFQGKAPLRNLETGEVCLATLPSWDVEVVYVP